MVNKVIRHQLFIPTTILLLAIMLLYIMPEEFNEWLFRKGIYPMVRRLQNLIFGNLPFPGFLLVAGFLLLYLSKWLLDLISLKNWRDSASNIGSVAIYLLSSFFWLWGLHYGTPATTIQQDIDNVSISRDDLQLTIQRALETRRQILADEDTFSVEWPKYITDKVFCDGRQWVSSTLASMSLPHRHGANRLRKWPDGWLLMWGVAGIYFPFSGEPGVDNGLHALKMPHTALHEFAHSHGYTGEGDCNLIAYLACLRSNEPIIIYSALIQRLKDEMLVLAGYDLNAYRQIKEELPDVLQKDLIQIRHHHSRFRKSFTNAGEWVNDHYLKTLGIKDGVDNYLKWVLQLKAMETAKN